MTKPHPERKATRAKADSLNCLERVTWRRPVRRPMFIGDRLSDETGDYEVIGRPYTTAGGKSANVRDDPSLGHARVRRGETGELDGLPQRGCRGCTATAHGRGLFVGFGLPRTRERGVGKRGCQEPRLRAESTDAVTRTKAGGA